MNNSPTVSSLIRKRKAFRKALAIWFEESKRNLPWRKNPSLYKTVVSEFMLQQTQVKTVLPYFDRWLKKFPDFKTLANANESTVLKHWEGLGYYSRARNLQLLAKEFIQLPEQPSTPEDWQQFKGVGPYASAAITSIALKHPTAVVDGNVIRILTRLTADPTEFKDNTQALKALTPLAQELVDPTEPGRHNEAVMELGATLCTKANPDCPNCPVIKFCEGTKYEPTLFPNLTPKKTTKIEIHRAFCIQKNKILLHQIPADAKRMPGIWELPTLEQIGNSKNKKLLTTKRRGISNSQITEKIYSIPPPPKTLDKELSWVSLNQINEYTLSGPHKKWIELLSGNL